MRGSPISSSGTNTLVSTAAYDIPDDILFTLGDDSDIAQVLSSSAITADAELTGVIEGTSRHLATAADSLLISNITNDGDMQFLVSDGGHSWGILTFNADDHSAHFGQSDWGVDVKFWGATANYYLLWDESEDDLILAGTNATFSIDATLDSSSTTTGSFHTDGGVGIAKKLYVGNSIYPTDSTVGITMGTCATGIDMGDACTTGMDIGSCTTGIVFTGTQATAISIPDASTVTTGISILATDITDAISIGIMNTGDLIRTSSKPRSVEIFSKIATTEDTTTTLRGLWSRFRVDSGVQVGSVAGWGEGIDAIEANVKLYGVSATDIYCWQIAGVWAMLECETGGTINFQSGCHAAGLFAHIELTNGCDLKTGSAAAAVIAFSNSAATGVTTTGTYDGVLVDKESGKLNFDAGLRITSSVCDTGIDIGACTDGINFTGTCSGHAIDTSTYGDVVIGTRTAGGALSISTGGFLTGLNVGVEYDAAGVANTTDYIGSAAIFNYIHNNTDASGGSSTSGSAAIWANYEIDKSMYSGSGHSTAWFTIWADASGNDAHVRYSGAGYQHLQVLDLAIVTGVDFDLGATCNLFGLRIDSSIDDGITNNGTIQAINIAKASAGKLDWPVGIHIEDCTVGIETADPITSTSTMALTIGTTGSRIALTTATTKAISIWTTTADTSNTLKTSSVEINQYRTATAGSGTCRDWALKVNLSSTHKYPSGANAIYGSMTFAAGGVHGRGAALQGEIILPDAQIVRGTISCCTLEMAQSANTNSGSSGPVSFISCVAAGTLTDLDARGYLFEITGVTEGDGKFCDNGATPTSADGGIRCLIDGNVRYLLYANDAEN